MSRAGSQVNPALPKRSMMSLPDIKFKVGDMGYFHRMVELCGTWWEDSHFFKTYGMPYRPDEKIFQAIEDAGAFFVVVGLLGEEVVSCFVGSIFPYHFNTDFLMCSEIVWCVKPDLQKYGVASDLLSFVEVELKARKVDFMSLDVPGVDKFNPVCEFIEDKGFKMIDKIFFKEISHG